MLDSSQDIHFEFSLIIYIVKHLSFTSTPLAIFYSRKTIQRYIEIFGRYSIKFCILTICHFLM